MEDDIVLACLKIIAKYDKNFLSKDGALEHISNIKEIVLKQLSQSVKILI